VDFVKNSPVLWLCSVVQVEGRYEDVSEFCESLYAESIRSPYLLAFMIEILESRLESKECQDMPQTLQWAVEVFSHVRLLAARQRRMAYVFAQYFFLVSWFRPSRWRVWWSTLANPSGRPHRGLEVTRDLAGSSRANIVR